MISTHHLSASADATWISLPFARDAGISLLSAGDLGGRSADARNRRRAFVASHGAGEAYVRLDQRHSRRVMVIGDEGAVGPGDGEVAGDGMLTAGPTTLCVTVADCMPILLYDVVRGVRGLLHSGWKGTGILIQALRLMSERFGSVAEDVEVTLGPCIGSCCYHVDEPRAELFAKLWGAGAVVRREDAPYLDLRAANEAMVSALGVRRARVVTDCTVCGGPFGSFRRDGPGQYTHMLAWL